MPTPPAALRLRFSEPLDLSGTWIVVADERGTRVDRDDLTLGPPNDRLATIGLADLGEGVYTVRWSTLSQVDGHRWQGAYRFGVGRTPPTAVDTPSPLPSPAELLVQWIALIATALVVGGLAFRTWALEPALAGQPSPVVLARTARILRLALWLLAAASVGELVAALGLLSPQSTGLAPLGKAGALALLRLALAPMIGYLAAPSAPSGSAGMALAFAGMLVLTRGQVGHAAAQGLVPVLVDTAHQLAATVWLGGVAMFAALAPTLRAERAGAARAVVARFWRLAAGAAALALLTGLLITWILGLESEGLFEPR